MRDAFSHMYPLTALVLAHTVLALGCSSDDEKKRLEDGNGESTASSDENRIPSDPENPATCAQAESLQSYVGCDFWPTVTLNGVWSIFDFAVIVANTGASEAEVVVSLGEREMRRAVIAPGTLSKIFLPWVAETKGPDAPCVIPVRTDRSIWAPNSAYHLTSSVPVAVYQFSPLEYQPSGGPPGKDWSNCPGPQDSCGRPCLAYTNDASLLLPSTALTGNYRIGGRPISNARPGFIAITGLHDDTTVTIEGSATVSRVSGAGPFPGFAEPGGTASAKLGRGDVLEIVGGLSQADFSGSLVRADRPVQVISGMPCAFVPEGRPSCDHLEELVLPAEALDRRYFVAPPTGPFGSAVGHSVRLVGNVNGTTLDYPSGKPPNAPESLDAGQTVDLGIVTDAFEVVGNHEFLISTFLQGGSMVDPRDVDSVEKQGDPSQTFVAGVAQFRKKYVFLAPTDYNTNFADVVMPMGAQVTIDGEPVPAPTAISSDFGVSRIPLAAGQDGAHLLESAQPVGIQVMGYGDATSYQYPGGMNLRPIADAPPQASEPDLR